jgi:hypothetical protein
MPSVRLGTGSQNPNLSTSLPNIEGNLDTPPTTTASSTQTCPHLGMRYDSGAFYSYPTKSNCCYRCFEPATPLLQHQEIYCLGGYKNDCPVYIRSEYQVFPPHLTIAEETPPPRRKITYLQVPALIIAILLMIFLGIKLYPIPTTGHALQGPTLLPTQITNSPLQLPIILTTSTANPKPAAVIIPPSTDTPATLGPIEKARFDWRKPSPVSLRGR